MKLLKFLLSTFAAGSLAAVAAETKPPAPFGPVPTERQLRWHEMEFYGFLHFTVNTFTDKEWGYGDEDEKVFNPSACDADQIVRTASEAGMKGLILTAKHHDGFCLWPSRYTEHSIKNSPWKSGQGDVVKEISEACRKHGLRFGVYLSPWDRNHKDYARPEYLAYYRNQLRELLTYQSVGRGACLNLNLPPDRRGRIHENDVQALRGFRRLLDQTFATNLAANATLTASNSRGRDQKFAPENLLDRDRATYWSTDDEITTPELVINHGRDFTFNVVGLREYLPLGQRVEAFALDRWKDGRWEEFAKGSSIGNHRLVRSSPVTTDKVRLRITQAPVCPALSEFGLFAEPAAGF